MTWYELKIIFCRLRINLSWDGLIIVVNSVGFRRARQETIKALAENHKINLNISKQIEEMSQIKKRVKTGHKRTGTKTKSDIKRKTGMVERLVLKLCRPHYLFLQAEKTISHRTKILSIKNAHFMKNYYLFSYESIKLKEIFF